MSKAWVFQESTLEAALEDWARAQIAAYPHNEKLIQTAAAAMRDFLNSPQAADHNMVMNPTEKLER